MSQLLSSCFSTATTLKSKPYLLLGTEIKENILHFNLYDPTRNKDVVKNLNIQNQNQTLRNLFQESEKIGSSRGYLALRKKKDSSVYLVNISNPLEPNIISLPPLDIDFRERHVNVSVSSPVKGDVMAAVKFYGARLSICRVGDSEWTWLNVLYPSFHSSSVIYSERYERFYLNSCNPKIDFTPKSTLRTRLTDYLKFPTINLIEEFKKDLPSFSNFKIEQQLVESCCGQSFIVFWFVACFNEKGDIVAWDDNHPKLKDITAKTHKIFVYKQNEEEEIGEYTDNIGDLCIFIGKNEAFCVSASDYSGLKPNSVYFAGHGSGFGVCDLSSQTIFHLSNNSTPQPSPMFWISPSPTPTLPS